MQQRDRAEEIPHLSAEIRGVEQPTGRVVKVVAAVHIKVIPSPVTGQRRRLAGAAHIQRKERPRELRLLRNSGVELLLRVNVRQIERALPPPRQVKCSPGPAELQKRFRFRLDLQSETAETVFPGTAAQDPVLRSSNRRFRLKRLLQKSGNSRSLRRTIPRRLRRPEGEIVRQRHFARKFRHPPAGSNEKFLVGKRFEGLFHAVPPPEPVAGEELIRRTPQLRPEAVAALADEEFDLLFRPQKRVDAPRLFQRLRRAARIEEVILHRQNQRRMRRAGDQKVRHVAARRPQPRRNLFRIGRQLILKVAPEGGKVTGGSRHAQPVVQREKVARKRSTAGSAGHGKSRSVNLGTGGETVERRLRIGQPPRPEKLAAERELFARHVVLPDTAGAPRILRILLSLPLPYRIDGEHHRPFAGKSDAAALLVAGRLAVVVVAEQCEHAGRRSLQPQRPVEDAGHVEAGGAFEKNLLHPHVVTLDHAGDGDAHDAPLRQGTEGGADPLTGEPDIRQRLLRRIHRGQLPAPPCGALPDHPAVIALHQIGIRRKTHSFTSFDLQLHRKRLRFGSSGRRRDVSRRPPFPNGII